MKKAILSGKECASLLPHWPELDVSKMQRLSKIVQRGSNFPNHQGRRVMSCPPILIDMNKFILNGKHRAVFSFLQGCNLEACIISQEADIIYHTPKECFGELSAGEILEAYERKNLFISMCKSREIYTIRDLARTYADCILEH